MLTEQVIFVRFKTKEENKKTKQVEEVEQVMKQEQFQREFPEPAEGEVDKFELEHTSAEVQVGETKYPETIGEAMDLFGGNEKELVNQICNAASNKQENYFRSTLATTGVRAERFEISSTIFPAYEALPRESQRRRLTDEEKLRKLFPGATEDMLKQAAVLLKAMQPQEAIVGA